MTKAKTENHSSRMDSCGPKKDITYLFIKNTSSRYETKK